MFNSKPAHQAVQCKISCSPHPWVEQPEDEGAEEAEAGEEKIDRKVNRWRWLRVIVKILTACSEELIIIYYILTCSMVTDVITWRMDHGVTTMMNVKEMADRLLMRLSLLSSS